CLLPQLVPGLSAVKSMQAGENHVLVTLLDGTVQVWGANLFGQLGIEITANQLIPIPSGFQVTDAPYSSYTINSLATNNIFSRGTDGNHDYGSVVIPQDFQKGVALDLVQGNA